MIEEYKTRMETGQTYLAAARGMGYLVGPLLGGGFFFLVGFMNTFFIFTAILLIGLALSIVYVPKDVTFDRKESVYAPEDEVTYSKLLSDKRILLCLLFSVLSLFFSVESYLVKALKQIDLI
jgi:4-hydroxybenzoate polyprenyltransferase